MLSRRANVYPDFPTITPAKLLRTTLLEHLQSGKTPLIEMSDPAPQGYHLAYFPNTQVSELLPDGTDSLYSPGPLWTRRLWAGGSLVSGFGMPLNGTPHFCTERISEVQVKGREGAEKIFVKIHRSISGQLVQLDESKCFGVRATEDSPHPQRIVETRTLVFMQDKAEMGSVQGRSSVRILRPPEQPNHSRTMTPTAQLLFRFSALTWNAHKIHLDRQYCQQIEGYRNLLVHGPLTLILLLEVLKEYRSLCGSKSGGMALDWTGLYDSIEYRNLAPLYADEPLRICVKEKPENNSYVLWIEDKDGRLAVKGTARRREDMKLVNALSDSKLSLSHSAQEVTLEQADEIDDASTQSALLDRLYKRHYMRNLATELAS